MTRARARDRITFVTLAIDRYERLALFRRKIAIQAFDEARRATGEVARTG
jgi:hypothetical protein